jgi:uncharacterized RDD family membrane protein YckC
MRGFFLYWHVDRDQLRIAGLTGVEIALDIAGPGSRSYAFVIDWHIRVLLALAWFAGSMTLLSGIGGIVPTARLAVADHRWIAVVPALCIYFFYHIVLEVLMQGRTPGKRMAGVRIVTRNGGTPSVGALLIRNIFRLIDCLPALYLLGLLICIVSEQRVRIGDMAAGTLLVLENAAPSKSLATLSSLVAQTGLAPNVIELIADVLERWYSLDVVKRGDVARSILARVEPGATAEALMSSGDLELQRRLRALLKARVESVA